MPLGQMLAHTPPWVWALFVFLMLVGIKALRPREVSPARMLILPLVFLAWALAGIFGEIGDWAMALAGFAPALAVGFALVWWIAGGQAPARLIPETGRIERPGSVLTLVLVVVAFALKYALSAALATHPAWGAAPWFALIFGAVSGLVDGAFWGQTLRQLARAYGRGPATA